MSIDEHRRARRHPVRQRALLAIGDECHGGPVCAGEIIEISLSGGLFAPDPAFQVRPGLPCRLTLMNGRNPAYLWLAAVVAGTRKRHIALRFPDPGLAGIHPGAPHGTTADVRSRAVALLTA